jgi:FAD/FMN-containing dehydrogenase
MDYWAYDLSTEQLLKSGRAQRQRRRQDGTTAQTELPPEELHFLDNRLVGHVVLPGHRSYERDRKLFNHRYDPRPSAILYSMVEHDVRLCLEAVRRQKTPFRIRAGGNSFVGYSASDGAVIDVSGLNDVSIDPKARIATVGAGCSLAKLQSILAAHRLHLPLGDAKAVRQGGFMQGGGFGLTSRTYGMNSDHVLEVRVMLADGRIVRASQTVNHDLWWAVRGATGGNFGVLLTTRYRLHRAPEQHSWSVGFRLWRATDVENAVSGLMTLQNSFMNCGAPLEMNVSATVLYLAKIPAGPPKAPWLVIWGTYLGNETKLDALLDPLLSNPGCWPRFLPLVGHRKRLKFDRYSRLVSRHLRAEEWRSMLSHFLTNAPNRQAMLQIDLWGGAISSYPRESSAFTHRDSAVNIALSAWWEHVDDESAAKSFLASWSDLVSPFWNGGIYQNFPSADAPNYRKNYWGAAYPALAAIKRKYDPDGLFDFPQAIKPGSPRAVAWPSTVQKHLRQPIKFCDSS